MLHMFSYFLCPSICLFVYLLVLLFVFHLSLCLCSFLSITCTLWHFVLIQYEEKYKDKKNGRLKLKGIDGKNRFNFRLSFINSQVQQKYPLRKHYWNRVLQYVSEQLTNSSTIVLYVQEAVTLQKNYLNTFASENVVYTIY